ncbi:unnamed protein product [Rotaria sp. Silwood1]|nr:unnamed protein product [Rotaria sp. Silwood1]CAF1609567.1 unnamed protein product [Rotaria sp. Silwood1]CAF3755206.1 unnamed protein product [Rotaria sp. Silwood1]CAF3774870.1 unnamed protein product [Rotaria sp. Silwood1]CAF3825473.1 unnamed protein product [Rotaria sp. Silwood1]
MFLLLYFILFISSIKACPLKTVDIHSGCYCGIEIDGKNYIHCHPYSINNIPEFTRSYIYDKLNLSNNFIEYLTNKSFHQLKIRRIYIEKNPINYIDKQTFNNNNLLHYLEELYIETINNSSLEFLCYGIWKKLRILKLSRFNLNQYQYCFNKLNHLEKLIIQYSYIHIISYHIYKLPILYELSLINNHIEYFNFDDQYLIYSSSIQILNLTSNQLQTIPNDLNIRLPHLMTLDLSNNLIENLPLINEITKLNVNLSYNLINYVHLNDSQHLIDLSFNPICTIEQTKDISNIIMNNIINLHCDCRLGYFLKNNLTNLSQQIGNNQPFGNQTLCATPQIFKGQLLKDLTYEQLLTTCSLNLPNNCKEVTNFQEIQEYIENLINITIIDKYQQIENSTQIIEISEKFNNNQNSISSFYLTSFNTYYENNDLLIFWDFDTNLLTNYFLKTKFQIIIEQEYPSKIEIIRQTDFISPYLKQYIIHNLPSNQIYHICLLITRLSYGTDKYCREITTTIITSNKQTLFINRSIIFGFLIGTILTICFLIILSFICRLHYKQNHSHHLFHQHNEQKHNMYMDRNNNDNETYTYSFISSPSIKYYYLKNNPCQTCIKPTSSWHYHNSKQLPCIQPSSYCLLKYHNRTLSDSITINPITSLSSEYSNGIDKEPITSTSIMSNTSLDEQSSHIIQCSTKHVYEELGDTNLFL